jgi:hypothetical protein
MRSDQHHSVRPGETRRQFIKKTGFAAAAVTGASLLPFSISAADDKPAIAIVLDESGALATQPPVQWAVEQLRDALTARGLPAQIYQSLDEAPTGQECVLLAGPTSPRARQILAGANISLPDVPEALALARGKIGSRPVLLAAGSDTRGLVYALLELADRVKFASDPMAMLKTVKPISERPANSIRSIARGFNSDVEDKSWFQDRDFWPPYLTMLAANRFNRFNLTLGLGYDAASGLRDTYFYFAYPFLLSVPGYNVSAVPLHDAERDLNLAMLKFISDETARRGLQFQLGIWTHAFEWAKSPNANYTIEGLTPETQAPYCRDALRALLAACPAISGVTFRVHGESGVPEGSYDLWKTIFDGVANSGRPVEIDMHAKGMDQPMIDVALGTGMPVNISPKFWAEHMGLPYMQGSYPSGGNASRKPQHRLLFTQFRLALVSALRLRRFADRRPPLRHIVPDLAGTQRLLLWGDPEMAAAYGRVSSFCGSNGAEIFEPLFFKGRKGSGLPGGRDAYADPSLLPAGGDFEKYDYTYRVWGRNLYNPDGDADGWRRALSHQFGNGAEKIEGALAAASRILPLVTTAHCPSAANNNYWPEMYFNMPIVDASRKHPYTDTPSPKRLGTVGPLDPEFFLGMDEFAGEMLKGESSGKYSPAWVANQLDTDADASFARLREGKSKVRDANNPEFRRLAVDVTIQAGLGRFLAAKFRAGVLFAIYEGSLYEPSLEAALKANRAARAAWVELAGAAKGIYAPDITFGPDYFQRSHWLDRLPAMDDDLADMEAMLARPTGNNTSALKADPKLVEQAMHAALEKPKLVEFPSFAEFHTPPPSFQRSQPLTIVTHALDIAGVRLRYRHVNQAEIWQMVEMEQTGKDFRADIPAVYTDSPFPLQYHFQTHDSKGVVRLHPGLQPGWHGQPYFVVRRG